MAKLLPVATVATAQRAMGTPRHLSGMGERPALVLDRACSGNSQRTRAPFWQVRIVRAVSTSAFPAPPLAHAILCDPMRSYAILCDPMRSAGVEERTISSPHIALVVASLADLRDYCEQAVRVGGTYLFAVNHGPALSCHILDPEGHQIELDWPTGRQLRR